jgi:hypothetical protein
MSYRDLTRRANIVDVGDNSEPERSGPGPGPGQETEHVSARDE